MIKISEALKLAARQLRSNNNRNANLEANILLEYGLNKPLSYIITHHDTLLTEREYTNFKELINKRLIGEPIAYIIGLKEFYGYEFTVNSHVLIPRPDTELLIDVFKKYVPSNTQNIISILELGVGSGCIIISLLLNFPSAQGTAVDISLEAIKLAVHNAKFHKVDNRLTILKSDWLSEIPPKKFNFIISNPPYISYNEDITAIANETQKFEPHLALYAEENGLAAYKIIAQNAKNYLTPNGLIMLEIGYQQALQIHDLYSAQGYILEALYQDLSGHDRVLVFKYPL